jgi:hypothetical protein
VTLTSHAGRSCARAGHVAECVFSTHSLVADMMCSTAGTMVATLLVAFGTLVLAQCTYPPFLACVPSLGCERVQNRRLSCTPKSRFVILVDDTLTCLRSSVGSSFISRTASCCLSAICPSIIRLSSRMFLSVSIICMIMIIYYHSSLTSYLADPSSFRLAVVAPNQHSIHIGAIITCCAFPICVCALCSSCDRVCGYVN